MKLVHSAALVAALSAGASTASAQVQVDIKLQLPVIRFTAPPPLVVVAPGIQVVPDYPEEVFFVSGWYWLRVGPTWYRSKDHSGGWVVVAAPAVPAPLVKLPPGKYKKFKGAAPAPAHEARLDPPGHDDKGHGKGKGNGHGKGHGKGGKH